MDAAYAAVDNAIQGMVAPSTDALGRRTKRVDTLAVTNTFDYNMRSELQAALMGTNSYGYSYDPIGNRLVHTENAVTNTYQANSLNQYTNIANGTVEEPTYDDDGNMLTHAGWTYTWDGENRLIAASNETQMLTFAYDYMGRRVQKVSGGSGSTPTVTNSFIYDGWNLIQELVTSDSSPITNYYAWGLDLSGSLQGAGGIGGLIAVTRHSSPVTSTHFACYDANGNITDYVDTNGTVVAHYEYGPFGGTIQSAGTKKDDFAFRFSTKYLDETGLYYYGHRYYSPSLGRWPSRDPIGELAFQIRCIRKVPFTARLEFARDLPELRALLASSRFYHNSVLHGNVRALDRLLSVSPSPPVDAYSMLKNNAVTQIDPDGRGPWTVIAAAVAVTLAFCELQCVNSIASEESAAPQYSDDGGDHVVHCITSCRIVKECAGGSATALAAGTVQDPPTDTDNDSVRDRAGNATGRQLGRDGKDCKAGCELAYDNGEY